MLMSVVHHTSGQVTLDPSALRLISVDSCAKISSTVDPGFSEGGGGGGGGGKGEGCVALVSM